MYFWRNVVTTFGFFWLRLAVALCAVLSYLLVAAGIQYGFIQLLGESAFNYIVSGLVSLLLGVVVCERVGALLLMFVRGWHVAALAYAAKIRKSHAPAIIVGINAFNKNLVGFGAVYGVKTVAKNLLAEFRGKLWDLLNGGPVVDALQKFSENPIVEHLAGDVLDYGFDATMYYLIKHPPEDLGDAMSVVVEGLRKYLYCIPSVLITSVGSYILFSVIPRVLKWLAIVSAFVTQGITAGILLSVLMWPLFYILEQGIFKPLTMVMFISSYAKRCDKEFDKESPVIRFVDSILDGSGIGVDSSDLGTGEEPQQEEEQEEPPKKEAKKEPAVTKVDRASEEELHIDATPDLSDDDDWPLARPVPDSPSEGWTPRESRRHRSRDHELDEDRDNGIPKRRRIRDDEDMPNWFRNSQPEGDLEDLPLLDNDAPPYRPPAPTPPSGNSGGLHSLNDLAAMFNNLTPSSKSGGNNDDDDDTMSGGLI